MTAPQSFGEWLRHRRRELDLTQDALAALVVEQNDYHRAAPLFGMVGAQLEVIRVRLILSDEIVYRHYLAALQAELETPAYATAYAEGRTLTLEQALEFALQS